MAGCIAHLAGSTLLRDMGGLRRTDRALAGLFALGLAALAGLPPLAGFWSKEAVLCQPPSPRPGGPRGSSSSAALLTTLVTGAYAGRALAVVALGDPPAPAPDPHPRRRRTSPSPAGSRGP